MRRPRSRSKIAYVIPEGRRDLWFDTIAIPADAPHPGNAHAFLNFLMEPEVIAAISNEIGYANGNLASRAVSSSRDAARMTRRSIRHAEVLERLHPSYAHSQDYSRELNRAWTRIKTGQ